MSLATSAGRMIQIGKQRGFLGGILPVVSLMGVLITPSTMLGGDPTTTTLRILPSDAIEQKEASGVKEPTPSEGKVSPPLSQEQTVVPPLVQKEAASPLAQKQPEEKQTGRLGFPARMIPEKGILPVLFVSRTPSEPEKTMPGSPSNGASKPKEEDGAPLQIRELPEEAGKVPHASPPAGFAEVSHEPLIQVVVGEGNSSSAGGTSGAKATAETTPSPAGTPSRTLAPISPNIPKLSPIPPAVSAQPAPQTAAPGKAEAIPAPTKLEGMAIATDTSGLPAGSGMSKPSEAVEVRRPSLSMGQSTVPSAVSRSERQTQDLGGLAQADGKTTTPVENGEKKESPSLSRPQPGPVPMPFALNPLAMAGKTPSVQSVEKKETSDTEKKVDDRWSGENPSVMATAAERQPVLVPNQPRMMTLPKFAPIQDTGTKPSSAIVTVPEVKQADRNLGESSSRASGLAGSGTLVSGPTSAPSSTMLSGPIVPESSKPVVGQPMWPMQGAASAAAWGPGGVHTVAPPSRIALAEPEPAKSPAPAVPGLPNQAAPQKPAPGPVAPAAPSAPAKPEEVGPSSAPGKAEVAKPGPLPPPVDTRPEAVQWHRPAGEVTQVGPFEVRGHVDEMKVVVRRSKILRTKVDIYRVSVVDPGVCDVIQFTPRELAIVGRAQGATDVTFWFADERYEPITYLVRVIPDPELQQRREEQYGILEDVLAELFPESKVKLIPVADKLIVKGQARDAEEAAQIMAIIRGQMVYPRHQEGYGLVQGTAAPPVAQDPQAAGMLPAMQVINMLYIPGVHQVALRVKIAELNRSAARNFGVDMDLNFVWEDGMIAIRQLLNLATSTAVVSGTFDNENLQFGIHYLQQHGVMRILSEPTLVTLSGRPATFVAGGEFAVPTTVGVAGAAAVTTDFRAFGAIITFLPTVLDKDLIRLEVAPEFSRINQDYTVNGTPGLDTRAVTTTVELREGQTLAIAGLLEDSMTGNNASNIPLLGQVFGKRNMNRNETELIILVTPELIHPMEPEEVPPLPGFDVTEPTNLEFYLKGRLEGRPTHEYRSTVWPRLRHRYQAGGPATISGPFGHSK